MKIRFMVDDYRALYHIEELTFEINGMYYTTDGKGKPIDITIFATEETLGKIAEFAQYGFNIQPLDLPGNKMEELAFFNGATHEGLYARLPEFQILEENGAWYW